MAGRIEGARWTTAVLIAAGILLGAAGIGLSVLDARPSVAPARDVGGDDKILVSAHLGAESYRLACEADECLGLDVPAVANASIPNAGTLLSVQFTLYANGTVGADVYWPDGTAFDGVDSGRHRADEALAERIAVLLGDGVDPTFIANADPVTLTSPQDWSREEAYFSHRWFTPDNDQSRFAEDEDVSIEARAPVRYGTDYGSEAGAPAGAEPVDAATADPAPSSRIFGLTVSEFIGVLVMVFALLAAGACGLWALLTRDPDRRAMLNRYTTGCVTFIGGAVSQTFGG